MCPAVALLTSELPDEVLAGLSARVHTRGGEREVRFYWRAVPALVPVWWNGRLRVRWGGGGCSFGRGAGSRSCT